MSQREVISRRVSPRSGAKSGRIEIDDVVVDRLLAGDVTVPASWWELDAAMVTLERGGRSDLTIAERLGITKRTVQRHKARRRLLMEGL